MITIKNESIATIPTLHVVKANLERQEIPLIFFMHGFTSAKEHNLHVAYLLAEKGFRVLLPDALHHGMREEAFRGKRRELTFWDIILTSIKEIEQIKIVLVERGIVDEKRIGMIGTSMGAMTMYGALVKYDWIKTACSFMGTAYYESFAKVQLASLQKEGEKIESKEAEMILNKIRPYDLSTKLNRLAGRPLFIWHGKDDQTVPYSYSEKLHSKLATQYVKIPEQLQLILENNTGHRVSRLAILKSIDWFEKHFLTSRVVL